jgi:hypothetical protein
MKRTLNIVLASLVFAANASAQINSVMNANGIVTGWNTLTKSSVYLVMHTPAEMLFRYFMAQSRCRTHAAARAQP